MGFDLILWILKETENIKGIAELLNCKYKSTNKKKKPQLKSKRMQELTSHWNCENWSNVFINCTVKNEVDRLDENRICL